ncbi:FAD-binding oxidoreductase [Psychrobacillus soli]|uniref:FAD-binding oxidoreductase n=1 Tax=Psychrobacillus soli TaxID=1543965 RepID=A0A544T5Q1_9BACI|nr:FAD-binding oxidoreductase [Psychrobacillus soli]
MVVEKEERQIYKYRYFAAFLYALIFISSFQLFQILLANPTMEDHGRLLPVKMKAIKTSDHEDELQKIILDANKNDDPISISGMQHSQGGQTLYPNGILLDMKNYDKILELDREKKLITVQSGATWADIQSYINPHGLALKVSQSQNIFTVGGSLSVNVHGRDIRNTSLIETVESFRLLNAEGNIMHVSRQENPELFKLVIGGYGLFGVILDITLQLTDDELYQIRTTSLAYDEYSSYFTTNVLQDDAVKMHLARISVAPESFLTEMYTTDYYMTEDQTQLKLHSILKRESLIAIPKFFLGLSPFRLCGVQIELCGAQIDFGGTQIELCGAQIDFGGTQIGLCGAHIGLCGTQTFVAINVYNPGTLSSIPSGKPVGNAHLTPASSSR